MVLDFKILLYCWLFSHYFFSQSVLVDSYLAVSFHSASSPSFRQISSSSVKRACGMCSSSSSIPSRNCTRCDGVSAREKQEFSSLISVLYLSIIKFSYIHLECQSYCMKVILCHLRFLSLFPVTSSCGGVHGDDVVCVISDPKVHAHQYRGYGGLPGTKRSVQVSQNNLN